MTAKQQKKMKKKKRKQRAEGKQEEGKKRRKKEGRQSETSKRVRLWATGKAGPAAASALQPNDTFREKRTTHFTIPQLYKMRKFGSARGRLFHCLKMSDRLTFQQLILAEIRSARPDFAPHSSMEGTGYLRLSKQEAELAPRSFAEIELHYDKLIASSSKPPISHKSE
jgi:hypothetical protein